MAIIAAIVAFAVPHPDPSFRTLAVASRGLEAVPPHQHNRIELAATTNRRSYARLMALLTTPLPSVAFRRELVLGVFIDVVAPWATCNIPSDVTITGVRRVRSVLYVTARPGLPRPGCIAIFETIGVHYHHVVAVPRRVVGTPLPRRIVLTVDSCSRLHDAWYDCGLRRP